jgi:hypothetical protein
MLAALRRARDGDVLARHLGWWGAAGRTPTDSAAVLCGSRARVDRTVRAERQGSLGWALDARGRLMPAGRPTGRLPTRRRALRARRNAPPRADGWGRTRGRGATRALTWPRQRRLAIAAETRRRWRHARGGGWTRAQLVATDEDPPRVHRLARRRWVCEPRTRGEALVCAEARARPLVPTVGWAWRPQGTPREVMTPGQPTTPSGAGALALPPGTRRHGWGPRPTHAWCRDLLGPWAASSPPDRDPRLSVVVDHDTLPQAQAVEPWLATHPRGTRLCVPTSGPRANPMARAVGDVHDGCPRNHRRQRVPDLVADVDEPRHSNGPWPYTRSAIDDDRAVTPAVETIASAEPAKVAA